MRKVAAKKKKSIKKLQQRSTQYYEAIGSVALTRGLEEAARKIVFYLKIDVFEVDKRLAKYHALKLLNPEFHPNSHGGKR